MNANQIDNLGDNGQIPIRYKLLQMYQEETECWNRPMTKRLNNNSVSRPIVKWICCTVSIICYKKAMNQTKNVGFFFKNILNLEFSSGALVIR